MKKITSFVMAALTAVSATTAFAGGIEPVEVEPMPEAVAGPTSSSSGGLLVLLLLGVTLAAVASGGGTDGTDETVE